MYLIDPELDPDKIKFNGPSKVMLLTASMYPLDSQVLLILQFYLLEAQILIATLIVKVYCCIITQLHEVTIFFG